MVLPPCAGAAAADRLNFRVRLTPWRLMPGTRQQVTRSIVNLCLCLPSPPSVGPRRICPSGSRPPGLAVVLAIHRSACSVRSVLVRYAGDAALVASHVVGHVLLSAPVSAPGWVIRPARQGQPAACTFRLLRESVPFVLIPAHHLTMARCAATRTDGVGDGLAGHSVDTGRKGAIGAVGSSSRDVFAVRWFHWQCRCCRVLRTTRSRTRWSGLVPGLCSVASGGCGRRRALWVQLSRAPVPGPARILLPFPGFPISSRFSCRTAWGQRQGDLP